MMHRHRTASYGAIPNEIDPGPNTSVIQFLDDADREVAIGELGEVCVQGPQVMRGDWEKPQANAEACMRDGYFRTGDVGVFDQRGFLSIVGRKKDMVIVSGFNVYPTEVESVASLFPGVMECACVGAPDDKTGEALVLHVVKKLHSELTAEQLIAHCRAALAGYKVPKIVCFEDALPKSTVGKILHRALCQSAERGAFPRFVLLLTQELSMTSDPAQVRLSQGLTRRHVLVFSVGAACLGGSGAFA